LIVSGHGFGAAFYMLTGTPLYGGGADLFGNLEPLMTVIVRKSGVQSSGQSDQISFGDIFLIAGPFPCRKSP
jgi:hypothetical protein